MEHEINKVICQCCGRQIVSYPADDQYTIGPASDGCLVLVNGYACPTCTEIEIKWDKAFGEE